MQHRIPALQSLSTRAWYSSAITGSNPINGSLRTIQAVKTLLADQEAREAGFTSVMWLDAQERRYVEECGVMNVFFVIGEDVVPPS